MKATIQTNDEVEVRVVAVLEDSDLIVPMEHKNIWVDRIEYRFVHAATLHTTVWVSGVWGLSSGKRGLRKSGRWELDRKRIDRLPGDLVGRIYREAREAFTKALQRDASTLFGG